jgi:ATP-binding cassette subfamily B protein
VPFWARARESSAALFGLIEERLSGTEDIRSSGAIDYTMNRLYQRSRDRLFHERRAAVFGSLTWLTPLLFFAIAGALTYWMGYRFYTAGTMTLGTVYVIFFYTDALLRPVIQITRQIEDLQKAGAGIVRVRELYAISSGLADGVSELPPGSLAVEFADVTFEYDDQLRAEDRGLRTEEQTNSALSPQPSVLSEISFQIAAGRTLGILGRTGSGKTTLTRLLFRLYDVTDGAIRLGDADLRDLRLDSLRQRVGMVTQDVQLFHATVRENLTFFDPSIADERIVAVLEQLELLPWYQSLENGLDTVLAGSGGLSAGEAQVLAFTRVFLRNPGLVILDEASSRLDPATERLIERAVDRLLAERTGIIIAHRLATVMRADDILILEGGRIREYGQREALRNDPGSRFAELLRTGMEEVLV